MNKGGRKHTDKVHELRLFIINNPKIRDYFNLSVLCSVNVSTVRDTLGKLNISQRRKPINCVG